MVHSTQRAALEKYKLFWVIPREATAVWLPETQECLPVHSMEAEKGHYKQSDELFLYQNKCIFTAL